MKTKHYIFTITADDTDHRGIEHWCRRGLPDVIQSAYRIATVNRIEELDEQEKPVEREKN